MYPPMTGKRSRWAPGAVYAVPLADGSFGFAQAIDAMMDNVIYVALFDNRVHEAPSGPPVLDRQRVVSLAATWRQHLNRGDWAPLGVVAPVVRKSDFPNERFARAGYVGAKHYDAGILADFLSAYQGLLPWNVLYDEGYYDHLLAPGVARPSTVRVLDGEARTAYRSAQAGREPTVT